MMDALRYKFQNTRRRWADAMTGQRSPDNAHDQHGRQNNAERHVSYDHQMLNPARREPPKLRQAKLHEDEENGQPVQLNRELIIAGAAAARWDPGGSYAGIGFTIHAFTSNERALLLLSHASIVQRWPAPTLAPC